MDFLVARIKGLTEADHFVKQHGVLLNERLAHRPAIDGALHGRIVRGHARDHFARTARGSNQREHQQQPDRRSPAHH